MIQITSPLSLFQVAQLCLASQAFILKPHLNFSKHTLNLWLIWYYLLMFWFCWWTVLQTIKIHQQAERDAALARLEQSRIVLAIRLSEHHGKKYKVIEEALSFVGDVRDAGPFVARDNLFGPPISPPGKNIASHEWNWSNFPIKFLISCFNFGKKSVKFNHMGGILGNAALVAISMLALLHLNPVTYKDKSVSELPQKQEGGIYRNRDVKRSATPESSLNGEDNQLDVLYARGWGKNSKLSPNCQMIGCFVVVRFLLFFEFVSKSLLSLNSYARAPTVCFHVLSKNSMYTGT